MKFRLLLSFLFIITTSFAAIHELEHIAGDHDHASCQVCVLDDNSLSLDIVDDFKDSTLFSFDTIHSKKSLLYSHKKQINNQSNAPPFIS